MNKYIILILIMVFISAISQIMLKISANKTHKSKIREIINPLVIGAYGIFFAVMIINTILLKHVDLKFIPVVESTGYIYILVLSALILKEKITKKQIVGNIIIIIGIIIFNL